MSDTMLYILFVVGWMAFWFGTPMVYAWWELHHKQGISIITGEPLVH